MRLLQTDPISGGTAFDGAALNRSHLRSIFTPIDPNSTFSITYKMLSLVISTSMGLFSPLPLILPDSHVMEIKHNYWCLESHFAMEKRFILWHRHCCGFWFAINGVKCDVHYFQTSNTIKKQTSGIACSKPFR